MLGPEPEFFVFDGVEWHADISGCGYSIQSEEASWASNHKIEGGNTGHRPRVKGGYFPVPPIDSLHDLRAAMCDAMEAMGLTIEVHHHEVATAGQCEIGVRGNTLVAKADEVQILKYCVHNVAHAYGKTATFMPKPLVGDNGSGMHVHLSMSKDGANIFAGDGYGGLSETALYYIGGIVKHAKALNAICNTTSPKGRRVEARFPDPAANPYLCFAALLMAGLDGIQNKIHPGDPADKDLYDLPPEEAKEIPTVVASLTEALDALEEDREFLTRGGVFTDDMLDAYIKLKREEVAKVNMTTHPVEFDLYYSV
jgi:glutamine synthetase